jgi:chemotaxis-related protein WspB
VSALPATTLFLLIRIGTDRYALDTAEVVEILPLVRLKALAGAPPGIAGMMTYRGEAMPVVDLGLLAFGTPTPARLMTRIIVVHYAAGEHLAIMVPEVLETARFDPASFVEAGVATDGAPYLGPILATEGGVLQRVTVSALLTDELRRALVRAEAA